MLGRPSAYSVALYFAVSCLDDPQLFDMADPPAVRTAQLGAAKRALPSGTFDPFTTGEWLNQDENTEAYSACTSWPTPTAAQPAVTAAPPFRPAPCPC